MRIFALLGWLLICLCASPQAKDIRAENGLLNLSSINSLQAIPLDGEWHFVWGKHASPNVSMDSARVIPVPAYWASEGYPNQGIATYQLAVHLPNIYYELALKLPDISSSYRLYVDDELLAAVGHAGKTAETTQPGVLPQVVVFHPKSTDFLITVHVSNFHHKKGGLWEGLLLGKPAYMRAMQQKSLLYDMFLIGAILIIMLYHVSLVLLRPNDYSALYFSLLCLFALFRVMGTNEMFILQLFPQLPWEWRVSMEHIPFYMLIAVGGMFMYSLFSEVFDKRVAKGILAIGCAFACANLLLPARIHSYLILYYEVYILFAFAYLMYVLARAIKRRLLGSIAFSLGFLVVLFTAINDILYAENVIHTFYMVPFGIFIFFFSQAMVLSARSTIAFTRAERLSVEMAELNERLEDKVAFRTKQLEQKNYQIGLVNEHLRLSESQAKLHATELEAALAKLQEAHIRLVKSEKMATLGELTAGITHEINNPINYVQSGISILKDLLPELLVLLEKYEQLETLPKEASGALLSEIKQLKAQMGYAEVREDLNTVVLDMENGIRRVIEIIKGLKTFSRGENVAPQPTDIHLCIDSSLTILKSQYKGRIQIERNYGQNIPPVLCLAGPIDQALINIIGNAIQAIEKEGTIRIATVFHAPKTVEISISDTGMGIPKELQQQIFQPFFTTKEVGKGTGLGLSITADIIRKHNGRISVASEEGKGTTFTILLPTDMKV